MAEALKSNDCLEALWMVGNIIGIEVVAMFARAGAQNQSLRCLGISTPDVDLPPAVLDDLEQVRMKMAHRKATRCVGPTTPAGTRPAGTRPAGTRPAATTTGELQDPAGGPREAGHDELEDPLSREIG